MNPDLLLHLRALTRFIFYVTEEEDVFLKQLLEGPLSGHADRTKVFNAALGLVPLNQLVQDWSNKQHQTGDASTQQINPALINVYKSDPRDEQEFFIITDPDRWLVDPQVQRRFLNIAHQVHNDIRNIKIILFVGPRLVIPQKLQRYIEVIHDKGLSDRDLEKKLQANCEHLHIPMPDNIIRHFRGLTDYEIDAACAQSIVRTRKDKNGSPKRLDPQIIAEFKRRQLNKTPLLSYTDTTSEGFSNVGGVERFKAWAEKTKSTWTEEGRKFGLRPPKGVLAVGVWGCGKSISVKALGQCWKLPVVQLEMGKLRSSGVGETESNVYRATQLIEKVAPCVTGETLVTLANGSCQAIEELWQDTPENLEVLCWNEQTLKVEITKVQAITRREAAVCSVVAANGFSINATLNHQHYVMRGGMPEWVCTEDLEVGDMLAVPLKVYDGNPDCSQFFPKGMRDYQKPDGSVELRRGGGGFTDSVVSHLPSVWSADLGWLLGVIEGDGYLGARSAIGFVNSSEALLDRFEKILRELFGLQAARRLTQNDNPDLPGLSEDPQFKPVWDTKVSNQLAAEFLAEARSAILTAPASVRAAFLAGWVDTDGCVGPEKVVVTVKGPKLREQRRTLARQLVQSLGITPSKFNTKNFEMTGSRAVALANLLSEHLTLKGSKAQTVSSSALGFDRGMGFACGALLSESRHSASTIAQIKEAGISTSVLWRHENGTTPVSERQLHNYIKLLSPNQARELVKLRDAECRWVEIQSIEDIGVQVVYDLACEGDNTHSFIANGLVTHNCIVWVDEAEKSMSGGQSSSQSDAGTTSRAIGILSTWLQETKAPVCLAMTANALDTLPIEFVNRMDERFFFNLPSEAERIEILKIHLRKWGQDPDKFNLSDLAEKAVNMVGREIEQAIGAAMTESFDKGESDALDADILLAELDRKPRIFQTMAKELEEIMDWVGYDPEKQEGIRARMASDQDGGPSGVFNILKKEDDAEGAEGDG